MISLRFRLSCLGVLLIVSGASPARGEDPDRSQSSLPAVGVSEMLDSLMTTTYFQDDQFRLSGPGEKDVFPRQFVPQFSDSVYASRIGDLARKSQFKLVYNQHVKGFIRVYAVDRRKTVAKMLGLTRIYFPLFEEKLKEYNIPQEMKYLAIVESALNPTAVSHAGARGLWQFMGGTGRMYGLQSSSFIEDRYDPYKATVAACEHLQDLYQTFGDWFLVLAAYNSGAGNVRKAIRASGGAHDYWEIWPHLPQETRGYVPAFIAVTYVMNYYREHNIRPLEPGYLYTETERVPINNALTFDQLQETIGVPMDDLKFLNPQYKVGLIPSPVSRPNMVRLPKKYVQPFYQKEQEIYAYHTERAQERERLYAMVREHERQAGEVVSSKGRKTHVVRKGESLAVVARKYRVPVSQLIAWNDLKSGRVKPGQQLVVFKVNGEQAGGKASGSVSPKGRKGKMSVVKAGKGKAGSKGTAGKAKASKGRKAAPAGKKHRGK
ncbi:MAG: transglycosylase SLT domain-containing protein [Chlorobiaceae bacterium]|nr:transglycosylase SLT domain-containing protein [Chlorobiaceae bacterium]